MAASAELSGLSDEAAYGACSEPDASTKDFMFQQTMLRVKDPKKSLDFYTRVLGMTSLIISVQLAYFLLTEPAADW